MKSKQIKECFPINMAHLILYILSSVKGSNEAAFKKSYT